jgi:hypothetical protein
MMRKRLRVDLHRDERGVAIAIVLLIGVTLVILSSIMVARGFRQMVNTAGDSSWDNALFAAEAGLDDGLVILDYDFDFTTGQTLPDGVLGGDSEKSWAIEAADALGDSEVVAVPDGEYALVRPDNADVLFAVGYSPARSDPQRRVRVVRASVEGSPWTFTLEFALLVGDDLELGGNSTINDTNDNDGASVHANGGVLETGSYSVEGCLTASESTRDALAACPPSPMPPEPVPVIEPRLFYPYAHYALCDDGNVYGGPAHPTDPDGDSTPCNGGETVVPLVGWSNKKQGGVWNWKTGPAADTDGVFYVFNGNFDGKIGDPTDRAQVTIILESGSDGACAAPATGNLELAGNSDFEVHPSLSALGWDIAVVAQGDVDYQGGATVGGAIFAHEQIDYRGTADSWGGVVAVEACHTVGSPLSSSSLSGTSVINYPGPVSTPFSASSLRAAVVGWYEL